MKTRVGVGLTICLFLGGFVMSFASACDDMPTHIFYGQEYDPALGCLESVTVVDTIGGADTGQACALVCVASPADPEAGVSVYISTTCPPYPPLFDVSGNDPQCTPALAAAKTGTTCLDDGGVVSTNPIDSGTTTDAASTD